MFDAYTIKKMLPRLLAAIVLVNLSWYICVSLLETSNVIGNSINDLLWAPFNNSNTNLEDINVMKGNNVGDALAALLGGTIAGGVIASPLILGWLAAGGWSVVLTALMPIVAVLLLAFVVLILREAVIIALILVSPIALALWVLPGTESWAKRWWSLFSKLLLMYPFFMGLLAIGQILAAITYPDGEGSILENIVSIGMYIAPYFMLPFLFKFVGGFLGQITGMINDREKGVLDRSKKWSSNKSKQGWQRDMAPKILQKRADIAGGLQARASRKGKFGSAINRFGARTVGGYNVEAAMSARNAQESKVLNEQIATGRDDSIRGLTVNRRAVNAQNTAVARKNAQGEWEYDKDVDNKGVLARVTENGTRQYKSLGGAWVDEAAVIEGHKRWGNNQFAQQAATSYEMRKAMTDEQVEGVTERYADLAQDQWGLTERQASGNWIGAGFENQNQHLEFKNTKINYDEDPSKRGAKLLHKKFADEMYEKKGSYPIAQMSGHTITQLGKAYDAAKEENDTLTMEKIKAVSETFVQRGVTGGSMVGDGDNQHLNGPPQTTDASPRTYSSGAAAVNEKINWLASKTGALTSTPNAPDPSSPNPPAPGSRQ